MASSMFLAFRVQTLDRYTLDIISTNYGDGTSTFLLLLRFATHARHTGSHTSPIGSAMSVGKTQRMTKPKKQSQATESATGHRSSHKPQKQARATEAATSHRSRHSPQKHPQATEAATGHRSTLCAYMSCNLVGYLHRVGNLDSLHVAM